MSLGCLQATRFVSESQHKVDGIIAMALRGPVRFEKQKQGTWRKKGIMPCVWMNKSQRKREKAI